MYVVAVDDHGEERNFWASAVEIAGGTCLAVINGRTSSIPLSQLMILFQSTTGVAPNTPRTVTTVFRLGRSA